MGKRHIRGNTKGKKKNTKKKGQNRSHTTSSDQSLVSLEAQQIPQYRENTALYAAILSSCPHKIIQAINKLKDPNDINLPRRTDLVLSGYELDVHPGATPLIVAIRTGNQGAVTLLLENGAGPNVCVKQDDFISVTPICLLTNMLDRNEKNRIAIIDILLEHGADVNITSEKQVGDNINIYTPFCLCIHREYLILAKHMIANCHINYETLIRIDGKEYTVFGYIIDLMSSPRISESKKLDYMEIIKLIVAKQPNIINVPAPYSETCTFTPLMLAVSFLNTMVFNYLLKKKNIDLSVEGKNDGHVVNALCHCIFSMNENREPKQIATIRIYFNKLLAKKAHLLAMTCNNPLLTAITFQDNETAKTLAKNGCDAHSGYTTDLVKEKYIDGREIDHDANVNQEQLPDNTTGAFRIALITNQIELIKCFLETDRTLGDKKSLSYVYNNDLQQEEYLLVSNFLLACISGNEAIATLLFDLGANPFYYVKNSLDKYITCMSSCIENGCNTLWPRLLEKVLEESTDEDTRQLQLESAFIAIINHGEIEDLQLIVQYIDPYKSISGRPVLNMYNYVIEADRHWQLSPMQSQNDLATPPVLYVCGADRYINKYHYLREQGWDFNRAVHMDNLDICNQFTLWDQVSDFSTASTAITQGITPLFIALSLRSESTSKIIKALVKDGADVFQKYNNFLCANMSAIDLVFFLNQEELIDLLCNQQQLLEYVHNPQSPILFMTLFFARTRLLDKLINAGYRADSNINLAGFSEYTCLDLYLSDSEFIDINPEILIRLIDTVDSSYLNSYSLLHPQFTILHRILYTGHQQAIQTALSKSPNIDSKVAIKGTVYPITAWHMAYLILERNPIPLAELLQYKFTISEQAKSAIIKCQSPLNIAICEDNFKCAEKLLQIGMPVTQTFVMGEFKGHNAITLALHLGRFNMLKLFIVPGIDLSQIILDKTIQAHMREYLSDKQFKTAMSYTHWENNKVYSTRTQPFMIKKTTRKKSVEQYSLSKHIDLAFLQNNVKYWQTQAAKQFEKCTIYITANNDITQYSRIIRYHLFATLKAIQKIYQHLSMPKSETYNAISILRNRLRHYASSATPVDVKQQLEKIIPGLDKLINELTVGQTHSSTRRHKSTPQNSPALSTSDIGSIQDWVSKPYWNTHITSDDMKAHLEALEQCVSNIVHPVFIHLFPETLINIKILIMDIHECNKIIACIKQPLAQEIRLLSNCIGHDIQQGKEQDTASPEVDPYVLYSLAIKIVDSSPCLSSTVTDEEHSISSRSPVSIINS